MAKKKERYNLFNTGDFYESLEGRVLYTEENISGFPKVVGFSDKIIVQNEI